LTPSIQAAILSDWLSKVTANCYSAARLMHNSSMRVSNSTKDAASDGDRRPAPSINAN